MSGLKQRRIEPRTLCHSPLFFRFSLRQISAALLPKTEKSNQDNGVTFALFADFTSKDTASPLSAVPKLFSACIFLPGDDNVFHTVLFWMIRKLHTLSQAPQRLWTESQTADISAPPQIPQDVCVHEQAALPLAMFTPL